MRVGRNQIQIARRADLYEYLLRYHPDSVKKAGFGRLQHKQHDSLIITQGKGFCHNSRNKTGNGVDYLMEYHGYSFQRAVAALATFAGAAEPVQRVTTYTKPETTSGAFKRVFAYLTVTRKIPRDVVTELIAKKLLSEDLQHNCVFASDACNYSELVGTLSDVRFKGIAPGSDADGYWVAGNVDADTVYICESAIDAVSLFAIQKTIAPERAAAVASIGGLKPAAVRRLQERFSTCVIAVDNDDAGEKFAATFPELRRIKSKWKDWNEDLCKSY